MQDINGNFVIIFFFVTDNFKYQSSWRGLIECGPLEKGTANHFSIIALRTPWTV